LRAGWKAHRSVGSKADNWVAMKVGTKAALWAAQKAHQKVGWMAGNWADWMA
jgi:hypothetical protein